MCVHSDYSVIIVVSRHQRMSNQRKYSGADEKIFQTVTSRGNKGMDLFLFISQKK